MKYKKLYLVSGSEDGVLGIFGNFKAAYERAELYFEGDEEELFITKYKNREITVANMYEVKATYANALEEMNCKRSTAIEQRGGSYDARIEVMWLNHNNHR